MLSCGDNFKVYDDDDDACWSSVRKDRHYR